MSMTREELKGADRANAKRRAAMEKAEAKRDAMADNHLLTYTQSLVRQFKRAGLPVLTSREPNRVEDGIIELTELVHVQVPAFAGYPFVVAEVRGKYKFLPPRNLLSNLIGDIKRHADI